ncbi:MAG: winged helix-turn-helix domain-containing protein [Ornithinimicrobium sp.]
MQGRVIQDGHQGPEAQGLVRKRLDNALFTPGGPRICLVTAPAGSGKSTLLAHVAVGAECPVAWLHVRSQDRAESDVLHRLTEALGGVPGCRMTRARHTEDLLAALNSMRAPLLIVIDDLHDVAESADEEVIGRLLRDAPPLVRFLVATRRPPAFDISRLLASGDMAQLDGEDLRFRSWEVEDLFRAVYQEPLSPEAAALLTRRLGGWAAGMQLFHLSVRDRSRSEREAGVSELTGRCKLIRSYLTRNVLSGLPPQRRDFLLRTSVLGVLTGPLCDALLDTVNSDRILQDLEREHFFTTSDDGLSYVYHQVLRNHLQVSLTEELSTDELSELLHAAGVLLEGAGHVQESARVFAQAGDWASVGRVIQQSRSLVVMKGDWSWEPRMSGAGVPDDPWLALARARRLFQRGSVAECVTAFRAVEELFDEPEARQRCATERAMATLLLPHQCDHVPPQTELHRVLVSIRAMTRRITAAENGERGHSPDAELVRGLLLMLAGSWGQAEQHVLRAAASSDARSWQRLAAGLVGAVLECRNPCGSDPTRALEEVSLAADVEGYLWLARVARGLQASSLVVLSKEPWRLNGCRDVVESCRRDGDKWGEFISALAAGVAALHIGEDEAGSAYVASAGELARTLDAPVMGLWVRSIVQAGHDASGLADSEVQWQRLARAALDLGIEDFDDVCGIVREVPRPQQTRASLLPVAQGSVLVRCMGSFGIETSTGGVDLTPLRPRARTLLMALALNHGRYVHRERLTDMLWPTASASRANHSLQVAISSIRQVLAAACLGHDIVQRHTDSYRLQIDDATLDITLFEDGVRRHTGKLRHPPPDLAIGQSARVLDLYRGDLLPEVGYADWVVFERDRLRQVAADYAVELARLCVKESLHASGIAAARRALELDHYQDAAWLLLGELQEQDGDLTASAATRARHAEIRDRLDVRAAPPEPAESAVPTAWRSMVTRSSGDAVREQVSGYPRMR